MTCDERLHEIVHGRVSAHDVALSEWLELVFMTSISGNVVHLNVDMMHKGSLYCLHHCITQIRPPVVADVIKETEH